MEIVKLKPAFQNYLWGGTKLKKLYNKKVDLDKVAESWELSNHEDGQSIVASGTYEGLKFGDYLKKIGRKRLGTNCKQFDDFPVLIKFIDAKTSLSVQVHPDDEYALRIEKEHGKTELWYVMDCEEDSFLYYGVNRDISKEEFKQRIEDNTVLEVLNKIPVKKGDAFFIEAGTIHAIGAGIVICEIQQNSNKTYRIYDFGRVDKNGNTRELHIDKAIDVVKLKKIDEHINIVDKFEKFDNYTKRKLSSCKYFTVFKYDVLKYCTINVDESSFNSVIALEGDGRLTNKEFTMDFSKGDSIFIPANTGEIKIEGRCQFILTKI
ncbi:class I mannose-6-phosphate isomerase [Clostridioides mangenotii]|uniref:type I phosphomannose isomerase catalytic subunit n=1 Tax=Metaclostridioides mangenotii TaxID=1540 RepID=UPI001C1034EF|nr:MULTISPECIES: type I phosphomannose isomerase catalytic subunit [Clostridioides]MBU5307396.1 class I mannose-6-phosphate isomerase [Clostridioides mangenotii]